MNNFSLEETSEKIYFSKTKEYFNEVLSSYHNENYRSAIVMLWSVVICDIIYKLNHLVDIYDDKQAKNILKTIERIQTNNPKSSEWEIKLIEESWNNTQLIDNVEYTYLDFLQKQRHLCAHPVLTGNAELHSPNKETVRSLLRNSLEYVLTKPPFYTSRILDEILSDISNNSSALQTERNMRRYLESRYLNKMNSKTEVKIFKSLWKLVFRVEDERCNSNRLINFCALKIIATRNKDEIQAEISSNQDFFSNISENTEIINFLIELISIRDFSFIYEYLTEYAKVQINHKIDTSIDGKIMAWFIKTDLNSHYNDLDNWISTDHPDFDENQIKKLHSLYDSDEWDNLFCKLISTYYGSSTSYNEADRKFYNLISYIDMFDEDCFRFLLQKIEDNNQTWGRGRARIDHLDLKNKILATIPNFDFTPYPNFNP